MFSLIGDKLVVSVGELSFFVQGGVRPKGSNAVVMRVRGADSKDKGDNIILAVRFLKDRDSSNLFTLLSCTPWIRPRKRKSAVSPVRRRSARRAVRPSYPPWFLMMGTREQENIRHLVSNAEPRYIEEGTIQRQLKTVYRLTHMQIEDAIVCFQPWRRPSGPSMGGSTRSSHYRLGSFSFGNRTDASSLPSIHSSKLDKGGRIPARYPSLGVRNPHGRTPVRTPRVTHPEDGITNPFLNNDNPPLVNVIRPGRRAHPNNYMFAGRKNDLEVIRVHSSKTLFSDEARAPTLKASLIDAANGDLSQDLSLAKPEHITSRSSLSPQSEKKLSNVISLKENKDSEIVLGDCRDSDTQKSPLTKQNLLLHDKLLAPIKGDYRKSVSKWLQDNDFAE